MIDGWDICREISSRWMSLDFTDNKSTLVQVMAWCRQATSHYLNQCWPRSLSAYGVTRPQWVKGHVGPDRHMHMRWCNLPRSDSRLPPSQWEMLLQSNAFSDWLGTNLESALLPVFTTLVMKYRFLKTKSWIHDISFTYMQYLLCHQHQPILYFINLFSPEQNGSKIRDDNV